MVEVRARSLPRRLAGGLFLLAMFLAVPTAAQEARIGIREAGQLPYLFVGAGYDDINDNNSPAPGFLLEAAWKEILSFEPARLDSTLFRVRPRAAVEVSTDGEVFAGAGVSLAIFPVGKRFFVEGSFLPGTYWRSDEYFPIQFRSQIGAGWQFDNGHQVALTVGHKSNNKWGPEGSSVETVLLRYGIPF